MRNFKITIQYEGTRYQGWQRQGSTDNTLQGKFEALLSRLAEQPVEIAASGRTDAGVHAWGQVANFHMDTQMTPQVEVDFIMYLSQTYINQSYGLVCKTTKKSAP